MFRADPTRWEILYEDKPIGYIQETRIGRARYPFYKAIGYFPGSGEHVCLELSTDFAERCDVLLHFQRSPQSSVHLPRHLRASS